LEEVEAREGVREGDAGDGGEEHGGELEADEHRAPDAAAGRRKSRAGGRGRGCDRCASLGQHALVIPLAPPLPPPPPPHLPSGWCCVTCPDLSLRVPPLGMDGRPCAVAAAAAACPGGGAVRRRVIRTKRGSSGNGPRWGSADGVNPVKQGHLPMNARFPVKNPGDVSKETGSIRVRKSHPKKGASASGVSRPCVEGTAATSK